jgi:glycerol-3-phosphate dehydrogenase (NAD(P)+)
MGDLVATCTSRHSRNRRAGELIAGGVPGEQVEARLGQVAEGLATAESLLALAARAGVELPISEQVAAAAFDGTSAADCLETLMARAPAAEE